jgi:signal transduction histidine kinase
MRKFQNISIVYKLSILISIIVIASIVLIGIFSYQKTRDAILERTFNQLTSVRYEKTARINSFITAKKYEIEHFANAPNTSKFICNYCSQHTQDSLINNKNLSLDFDRSIGNYLRIKGDVEKFIIISNNTIGLEIMLSDSLKQFTNTKLPKTITDILNANNSGTIISDYILQDGQTIWYIFTPVISENTNAYIGYVITPEAINSIMLENNPFNGLGESGEAYLVGTDYLMRSKSRFIDTSVMHITVKTKTVESALNGNSGEEIITDYRGIKVLSSYGYIDFSNIRWVVLAEIDYNEAFIPVNSYRNSILFLGLVTGLLLSSFIMLLMHTITQPVTKLKQAADQISTGKYDIQIDVKNEDELGQLTDTFNKMAHKISDQQIKLQTERKSRLSEMIDWQEQEKQRFSRELHDGLGQLLLSIKLRLGRAKGLNAHDQTLIEESGKLLADAVQDVRNISNDLMPTELIELGLCNAIKNMCTKLSETTDIRLEFNTQIKQIPDKKISTYIYRIIQEALNNTIKHSQATKAKISLSNTNNMLILQISDNGKGIETNLKHTGGQGIRNMKERTLLLDGNFKILASKEKGTTIIIEIPYKS